VWGQTGSRPVAPKDLGFASAYVFGVVCPSICNTVAVNHDPRVKPGDQQSSRRPPLFARAGFAHAVVITVVPVGTGAKA
jgi:hypothetical protein